MKKKTLTILLIFMIAAGMIIGMLAQFIRV